MQLQLISSCCSLCDANLRTLGLKGRNGVYHHFPPCWFPSGNHLCLATSQFSSLAQSCPTLCNPMDCSTSGLPVHLQLLEFTQTHVYRVGDAIQPSHPLSSPPPSFNVSIRVFSCWVKNGWVSSSYQVAKVLELQLQYQSCQQIFRTDFLQDWQVGSPYSPRNSQESYPTLQFKSINFLALSFLYGPTLTSIHDYWKKP